MSKSQLRNRMQAERRMRHSALDPAQKMISAATLSVEARKMRLAGLRAQGFSEEEIIQILKSRRK
jgi:hypothetical protein